MMYHSDSQRAIEREAAPLLVWLSLLGGLMLNLLPYPDAWFVYKPDFVALLMVYWALRQRHGVPVLMAVVFGVLMDVSYTAILGQHAFAYAVLLFVAMWFKRAYVIARPLHQSVFVCCALAASIGSILLVSVLFEQGVVSASDFLPALVGAGLWFSLPLLLAPAHSRFTSGS